MITLRADNRVLTANSKFAYLTQNYASGQATIQVTNSEPFTAVSNCGLLIGEMGQSDAEVLAVSSIASNIITLADTAGTTTTTAFAHAESTRVVALPYDQIRFYWTAATNTIADENPEFSDTIPLTGWMDLDPSSYYSTFQDTDNNTGFGWFVYRDRANDIQSQVSNPIPYAGFTGNTAQQVFQDFESLLNTNELKLVSVQEKFAWLNEALAFLKNKLNLTNVEYTVSVPQYVNFLADQAEYILPDDFSDVVEITDSAGTPIEYISVSEILAYAGSNPTALRYYLRGRYLGFTPTPTAALEAAIVYTYRGKAVRVSSLSTYIDLPDNAFYSLKDWMMFRAMSKFNNPMAQQYYQYWKNSVDLFIQAAVKRDANLDTWGIASYANN